MRAPTNEDRDRSLLERLIAEVQETNRILIERLQPTPPPLPQPVESDSDWKVIEAAPAPSAPVISIPKPPAVSTPPAPAPAPVSSSGRELIINNRRIADNERAYLIAEIGHNHAGELGKAIQMVDDAIAAGADAVKFQTRTPLEVYARGTRPGAYDFQSDNPQWMDSTYGTHREKLEFDPVAWDELFKTCKARGITAFSTPFDHKSADLLARLEVPAFKIASGDATNTPLLKHVASFGKPMIVSTGGCNIEDVDRVVETLTPMGAKFALLQCSCIYPAPVDVLNLRVLGSYRERYPEIVAGLSTHSPHWTPTLAAFALGGRIFEHHFTHDRNWKGTDNNFSLEPDAFKALRAGCDAVFSALGSAEKRRDPREDSYTLERQKAMYWRRDLPEGHIITADDMIALCPNVEGAMQPYEADAIVGWVIETEAGNGVKGGDRIPHVEVPA